MTRVQVLIPTYRRPAALGVTLTSLLGQWFRRFDVLVSDQSGDGVWSDDEPAVGAVARVLRLHGHDVRFVRHLPRRGMAEHRQFLLDQAPAGSFSLFLDDDVICEPWVLRNLVEVLERERCGFVGAGLIGPSYTGDLRPHEQSIEFFEGPVLPERVRPCDPAWQRHRVHNAANLWHVARHVEADPDRPKTYRVAWVGGCVLFDTDKLREAGGFSFWRDLPDEHAGEDVVAQLRVMERHGGCAVLPSGVYHQELPTTIPSREVDAPDVLV